MNIVIEKALCKKKLSHDPPIYQGEEWKTNIIIFFVICIIFYNIIKTKNIIRDRDSMKLNNNLAGVIFLTMTIVSYLGADESWKLYDDTQVAIINITVDPYALDWMYNNVESDSMHLATVHFKNAWIDESIDSVGLRLRGNTSRYSQKKSFKLSFNTFIPGREFYGVDKLNINGEHNDPSIIRSKLCWDFFKAIGLAASRAAHAALYINGIYFGLYISVEHVDDEFLNNHFSDDSGNLWKCLWPADLTYRGSNGEDYYPYHDDVRPYELKTNVELYDYSKLAKLIDAVNNTPNDSFADSLEQILCVPEVLKYFAINILTGSWDDYWFLKNNYYLYYEPALGKFHWIPYDYDNTFGVDWFSVDWAKVDPYVFANMEEVQGELPGPRPLAERLMDNAQYHNLYTHFLDFYKRKVYDLQLWESRLNSLKDKITPWIESDEFRSLDYGFTIDDFHNSYSGQDYSNQHVKRGIKEFVNIRNSILESQIYYIPAPPIIYALDWWPRYPRPQDTIYVVASVFSDRILDEVVIQMQPGDLPFTIPFPMQFSSGTNPKYVEDADRWIGKIPPLHSGGYGRFHILAKDNYGMTQVYPRAHTIYISAPELEANDIVINEFLAKNDAFNTDGSGEYDDWLEIYNPGSDAADLSGMYLTDNPAWLTKWQFPPDMPPLEPGSFLLIWCDEDSNQSGWHTNFRLAADGEFIALVAGDGVTVIDSITFGLQSGDISCGRIPDGSQNWAFINPPTPGMSNPTTVIESSIVLPQEFQLYQNYPNPFNPKTVISWYVGATGRSPVHIEVSIFNVLGKKVSTLISEKQKAGMHTVEWDASGMASGVYYYRLVTKNYVATKKLIILR